MKKLRVLFLLFICIFCFSSAAICEEKKSPFSEGSEIFNKGFENQEAVSDKKLQNTIKMLKERALTNKQKKIRKEVQPLSPASDEAHLKEFTETQTPDDELSQTLTVMIPMPAYNDAGVVIQPGYYKLSCRKVSENEYVLDLAQGIKRVLTVKAKQTRQDLEQESISFCNAKIIDNGRIRLMYGSIDLNLVGYLYFK